MVPDSLSRLMQLLKANGSFSSHQSIQPHYLSNQDGLPECVTETRDYSPQPTHEHSEAQAVARAETKPLTLNLDWTLIVVLNQHSVTGRQAKSVPSMTRGTHPPIPRPQYSKGCFRMSSAQEFKCCLVRSPPRMFFWFASLAVNSKRFIKHRRVIISYDTFFTSLVYADPSLTIGILSNPGLSFSSGLSQATSGHKRAVCHTRTVLEELLVCPWRLPGLCDKSTYRQWCAQSTRAHMLLKNLTPWGGHSDPDFPSLKFVAEAAAALPLPVTLTMSVLGPNTCIPLPGKVEAGAVLNQGMLGSLSKYSGILTPW